MNNFLNFNAKWALYSIINSANLAEFEVVKERLCFKQIYECCEEEEKYEEIQATFGTAYLGNCWAKFDMQCNKTVGHLRCRPSTING